MRIREIQSPDRAEWLRLLLNLYAGSREADHAPSVDAFLGGSNSQSLLPSAVFVAERAGSGLCGFLELSIRNYAEGCTGATPYVESWYVDSDVRGTGIGRQLVRAAEVWVRANEFSELASDAEASNTLSQEAHLAVGFSEVERIVVFRKNLQDIGCDEPASAGTLYRLSAFTTTPAGGNPAGVWIGEHLPEPSEMQPIAAAVGYSETIFVTPGTGTTRTVRYYSPEAEVPFCGHATIAAGAKLGQLDGPGDYRFETAAGPVTVAVRHTNGMAEATLTSVEPKHTAAQPELLENVLAALRWQPAELDPSIPPALAFAGAWHLVIAAGSAERLADLDYEFDALKALMLEAGITTVQLIWRESATVFHARNPFPVGGVVEDPATGAAAAALGGYLRDAGLVEAPATLLILQGKAMGRPSRITARIPVTGGIAVSGNAVELG